MENWDLIVKYLTNEISASDLKKLNDWLDQSEVNKKYLNQAKSIFNSSEKLFETYSPDTSFEWEKLKAKMDENTIPTLKTISLWKKHWWKVAAFVIVLVGITFFFDNEKEDIESEYVKEISLITISTQDSILIVELPDNTIIHLNKNSSIRYPEEFITPKRNVTLTGEAFFEVQADSLHPFIVSAGITKTTVLGTKFNIKANENEDNIEVFVVEGKVKFSNPDEEFILLEDNSMNYNQKTGESMKMKKNNFKLKWWVKDLEKSVDKLFNKIDKKIIKK